MNGITFEAWVGVDQNVARGMARDPDIIPMKLRVMFAAIGWANLIGHAEFNPAGLCQVLMKQDPKTGALSIPSSNYVGNVVKEARDMGLIGQGSSTRCLVAPPWWEKAGGKGGRSCSHHRIYPASHRRGVRERGISHPEGVVATPSGCNDNALTSDNVTGLYDSVLPETLADADPKPRRAS